MAELAVSKARDHLAEVIEEARRTGEPVYVTRRGRRVAVIVDPEAYERMIDTAEEAADRRELQIARDEGDYVPWEEVKAALGLRATVAIDDNLLAEARGRAHARRQTLSRLIEDALRAELARPPTSAEPRPVPVFTAGTGASPGMDLTSNRAMHETLDAGASLEQLR